MSDETESLRPERPRGLNPLDTLGMSKGILLIIGWLSRHRQAATIDQIVAGTGRPREKIDRDMAVLVAEGHIKQSQLNGEVVYQIVFGGQVTRSGRGVSEDIWGSIDKS